MGGRTAEVLLRRRNEMRRRDCSSPEGNFKRAERRQNQGFTGLERRVKKVVCVAVVMLLPHVRFRLVVRRFYRVFMRVQLQQQLVRGHDPREEQQQEEGAISGKVFQEHRAKPNKCKKCLQFCQSYTSFSSSLADNLSFFRGWNSFCQLKNCWMLIFDSFSDDVLFGSSTQSITASWGCRKGE